MPAVGSLRTKSFSSCHCQAQAHAGLTTNSAPALSALGARLALLCHWPSSSVAHGKAAAADGLRFRAQHLWQSVSGVEEPSLPKTSQRGEYGL